MADISASTHVTTSMKPPALVQVVVVLMWLGGFSAILQGIPLLFAFGVGIIFILLGLYIIKCANAINKMRFSGYKGSMTVLVAILIIGFIAQYFAPQSLLLFTFGTLLNLIPLVVLFTYRGRFVK